MISKMRLPWLKQRAGISRHNSPTIDKKSETKGWISEQTTEWAALWLVRVHHLGRAPDLLGLAPSSKRFRDNFTPRNLVASSLLGCTRISPPTKSSASDFT
jgi:hypothetical protein